MATLAKPKKVSNTTMHKYWQLNRTNYVRRKQKSKDMQQQQKKKRKNPMWMSYQQVDPMNKGLLKLRRCWKSSSVWPAAATATTNPKTLLVMTVAYQTINSPKR